MNKKWTIQDVYAEFLKEDEELAAAEFLRWVVRTIDDMPEDGHENKTVAQLIEDVVNFAYNTED